MSELAKDLSQLALKEEEEEGGGWGERERGGASRDRLTLPRLPAACSKPTAQPLRRLSESLRTFYETSTDIMSCSLLSLSLSQAPGFPSCRP